MKFRIIETDTYIRTARKIISDRERLLIRETLAESPKSGAIIRGSGGARKIRFAANNKGKSGGVRVIYYCIERDGNLLLLDIFSKSDKENLSKKEINELRDLLKSL